MLNLLTMIRLVLISISSIAINHSISAADQIMTAEKEQELIEIVAQMTDEKRKSLQDLLEVSDEQEALQVFLEISDELREKVLFLLELSDEEREKMLTFLKLNPDFKEEGKYKLPKSNSTISVPQDYSLLTGDDAAKMLALYQIPKKYMEAVVLGEENMYFFGYVKTGYVPTSLDKWNSKTLLESIENKFSSAGALITGWLVKPSYNKDNNAVFWATEVQFDDGNKLVNLIVNKLGREGVEIISALKNKDVAFEKDIDLMLNFHSFDPGFRYEDYTKGDKVSRVGIDGVVSDHNNSFGAFFKPFFHYLFYPGIALLVYIVVLKRKMRGTRQN